MSVDVSALVTENLDIWSSTIKAKNSKGRGSSKKTELYGVKKLRELILELAVRGLLVPQDPSDEPARELLKKIGQEKEQLIKDKKLKKQKPLSPIKEDEKPFDLPVGWEWVRLNDICVLENGDRSKNYPNKSLLVDSGIPFVNAGHLQDGRININEMTFITQDRYELLKAGKFSDGDILFCLRGSLGKSAIVENMKIGAIASSLVIVRLINEGSCHYVHNYFDSPLSYRLIKLYDNGTAQPNLSAADLGRFCVPFPPLAEQHRIVIKVSELMALCDQLEQQQESSISAHQTLVETLLGTLVNAADSEKFEEAWQRIAENFDVLFTTEHSIEQLKQTILQLAVMGKLVPQDPNDEPASVLLEKITKEKEQLVKEKKIKKQKPLPPITEEEKPFELPAGWEWARIDNMFLVSGGVQKTPKRAPVKNHYPYLAVANVQRGNLELTDLNRFEATKEELERYRLFPADLLVVEGNGSENEIGRCAIWSGEVGECIHQNHLIRCRPLEKKLSDWVLITLNSPFGICEMKSLAVTTSGLYNLSVGKIRTISLPVPPILEQIRINFKINELMILCDSMLERIKAAQTTQLNLADAITKQATA